MGVVASFTRLTPDEIDELSEESTQEEIDAVAERHVDDEPDGYIDKAFAGLEFLLGQAEVAVYLEADGLPIGDYGQAVWSVDKVRDAARLLRETPFERLAQHYDPEEMSRQALYPDIWGRDGTLDYLKAHYESLVEFFVSAAAAGHGLLRFHG